jgi:hypothetical protein
MTTDIGIDYIKVFERPGGFLARYFCSSPHPSEHVWCRRQPGHAGNHSAFVFSISTPEEWPAS